VIEDLLMFMATDFTHHVSLENYGRLFLVNIVVCIHGRCSEVGVLQIDKTHHLRGYTNQVHLEGELMK
jgi:hypothetical protein